MNKSKLKSYAPQARKDFIAMVQSRAAQLGISDAQGQLQIEPCEVQGQVAIIAGQAFPAKIANQRNALIARMQKDGFAVTTEAIAYTWFNRFAALRYMELHNYLGHGQRVLSSVAEGGLPDMLTHALELVESGDLPGISMAEVSELKLASKDGELYKRLLVAQCNQLVGNMGFLFERIDDDSELLLPDNLLRTDSVIRKLVDGIEEDDWQDVEIIGWLYQFYISEKKDQVIGKVVKSEDIPAATQLFTPNWIVKYLVQNSVGRLWLQANPSSTLASQMQYYIAPAEQTPEVNAQLDALIRARISEDGDTLTPESISVLDPACGSGHILVEAYDLLKAIYLERGYRERDIPRLILEKNLFGLDIDDRAAQLAAFALLMKARADDRRLFSEPVRLNVLSLQESTGLDAAQLAQDLGLNDAAERNALNTLLSIFTQAKTFGSLLQIPQSLVLALPQLVTRISAAWGGDDMHAKAAADLLQPLLQQVLVLARQYDAVVANPPYMGDKYFHNELKLFSKEFYKKYKSDLYAMFLARSFSLLKEAGYSSLITIQNWMFLPSFSKMRADIINDKNITNVLHVGFNSFPELNSKIALASACVFSAIRTSNFVGTYVDLNSSPKSADKNEVFNVEGEQRKYQLRQEEFLKIPSAPMAYWVDEAVRALFSSSNFLGKTETFCQGMATTNNAKYLRLWHEVDFSRISFYVKDKNDAVINSAVWVPYNKGGGFRKWYGNLEYVLFWKNAGEEIKHDVVTKYPYLKGNTDFVLKNNNPYFKRAVTWTDIGLTFGARYLPDGFMYDVAGSCAYSSDIYALLSQLGIGLTTDMLHIINPSLHYQVGDLSALPNLYEKIKFDDLEECKSNVDKLISISKSDWDSSELSWDFNKNELVALALSSYSRFESPDNLSKSYQEIVENNACVVKEVIKLEEKNNYIYYENLGLQDKFEVTVKPETVQLNCNLSLRLDSSLDSSEIQARSIFTNNLLSYAIGCMMGRYSLDEPGLVYAQAGNVGFDPQRYTRFAADADGIVPVSDMSWFSDDATHRVKEFLVAVWGQDTLAENLAWLADSLGRKADETAEDALRRYISGSFFKDHCQTYKKRPIYWLFSSGKQKAFEALVYLHRYNDSTLARMRAEYVVPLTGRMMERIKLLEDDSLKASTGAAKKAIDKQIAKLKKQLEELRLYDEKLRHFADQRVTIDLDDGVKVNYGKFGDLLDNVKGITGGAGDD